MIALLFSTVSDSDSEAAIAVTLNHPVCKARDAKVTKTDHRSKVNWNCCATAFCFACWCTAMKAGKAFKWCAIEDHKLKLKSKQKSKMLSDVVVVSTGDCTSAPTAAPISVV